MSVSFICHKLIDWFILIVCQPVKVILYLEFRELYTLYVYIYIFCVPVFLIVFFTWLYDIKDSYLIQIIYKQIYLTYRWDLNRYHCRSVDLGVIAIRGYCTVLRFPELEPYHQKLFSIISRTHFFWWKGSYASVGYTISIF